ncbi:MAG TPA: hypothetical protein DCX27_04515 [Balneola sp.]|nr:hypothetical protein [Balneola sp.]
MSIKKLFDAKKAGTLGGATRSTLKKLGDNVESPEQIEAALSKARAFSPKIDFSDPANFVKYGSAYRYYYDTFGYIKDYYPYDGSSREKLEFYNGLSPFEQYIFNNEYPKTTGYVTIGAIYGTDDSPTAGYTTPTTAEYIEFKGGPHSGTFFATGSGLSNNLEFGGVSGSTVEFYYNKAEFDSSTSSPIEVVLDIWNGVASGSHDYGRLTIETDSGSADRFYVSYQSGSSGVFKASIPTAGGWTLGSGSWDHYAFVFSNSGVSTSINLYENGTCKQNNILTGSSINLVTGSLIGRIGALRTTPGPIQPGSYSGVAAGDGKLSASLDEFRFWKEPRTAEEIGRNWYMGVNGGANTTINNSGLGIYYKFNEGITQVSTTDNVVLDYSSRLSNGAWTGYSTSGTRNTGSAIVSSSAAGFETADPIIYDTHPTYISSRDDLSSLGQQYDYTNNSSLYYTMPAWIIEQDERNGEELAKLTQIMGSYLDTLYAQVGGVLTVKDVSYPTGSVQESPNNDRLLSSLGFEAPDLFDSVV